MITEPRPLSLPRTSCTNLSQTNLPSLQRQLSAYSVKPSQLPLTPPLNSSVVSTYERHVLTAHSITLSYV